MTAQDILEVSRNYLTVTSEFKEAGETENGKVLGFLEKTGNKLKNTFKLHAAGIKESEL